MMRPVRPARRLSCGPAADPGPGPEPGARGWPPRDGRPDRARRQDDGGRDEQALPPGPGRRLVVQEREPPRLTSWHLIGRHVNHDKCSSQPGH